MKFWRFAARQIRFPSCCSLRFDRFGFESQIGCDTDQCVGLAGRGQCFEHGRISVGRFNKKLCLFFVAGALFQLPDAFHARRSVNRQIPIEGKILSTQAARHHCEQ